MDTKTVKPDAVGQKFADLLRELKEGGVEHEASVAMQTLVQAVVDHQKVGTLTLKIKVAPMPGKHRGRVLVDHTLTLNEPKMANDASVMYATELGALQRKDPQQLTMEVIEGGQQ